jgi:hypothetical protein
MQSHCTAKVATPNKMAAPAAKQLLMIAKSAAMVNAASVAVMSFQWWPGAWRSRIEPVECRGLNRQPKILDLSDVIAAVQIVTEST